MKTKTVDLVSTELHIHICGQTHLSFKYNSFNMISIDKHEIRFRGMDIEFGWRCLGGSWDGNRS